MGPDLEINSILFYSINKPFLTYSLLNNQSKFVITLFVFYYIQNAYKVLFLNNRNNIDIVYFRYSYKNWLPHISLKFDKIRQFQCLSSY